MAKPPPGRFDAGKLRETRIELGLSQVDLAKRIGVDPGVINSWETRGARPSVPNLGRVATALGLTVPDLYHSDAAMTGTLIDLRVRAGLSQHEAAELLNVSKSRISRWERGVSRPTWDEISSYAKVLKTDRITIGAAIDLTANQHGNPPKKRRAVRPSAFTLTASSPHIIYDFEDTEGGVELSSPQFPFFAFHTTFTNPLMRELAVINEYFNADYFHRYNHLQRRCQGPEPGGAVYLIRWLPAFHETTDLETHSRGITAAKLIGQILTWGFLEVGSRALPTGEYLIIVVEPEDTLEFLYGQISRGMPVTFYPTRTDDGIGPLEICWDDDSNNPTSWAGSFRREDMPSNMTYAELFRHLRSINPPREMASEPATDAPQTDVVRSIHRTFSKSAPRRQGVLALLGHAPLSQVMTSGAWPMKRRWVVTLAYGREPNMATMDRWESQLGDDATISRIPGRGIELTIHVDGTTLDQALATARASAAEVIDDVDLVGVEIIPEDEQLRRAEAFIDPPN